MTDWTAVSTSKLSSSSTQGFLEHANLQEKDDRLNLAVQARGKGCKRSQVPAVRSGERSRGVRQ